MKFEIFKQFVERKAPSKLTVKGLRKLKVEDQATYNSLKSYFENSKFGDKEQKAVKTCINRFNRIDAEDAETLRLVQATQEQTQYIDNAIEQMMSRTA